MAFLCYLKYESFSKDQNTINRCGYMNKWMIVFVQLPLMLNPNEHESEANKIRSYKTI